MSQQPKHHGSIPKGMHKTKPKEFKKTLLRLARYLKPRTFQLVLVVFAAILATLFNVISPKLLGDATSSLFASFKEGTGVQFGFLGRITLILAGLYLLSALFTFLQHYLMAGVAQKTIYEMRQEVNEKLTRLPLK
ncbi:ABC transporter transmembrane domain-containing protein, partial [Bacillus licheniformis]